MKCVLGYNLQHIIYQNYICDSDVSINCALRNYKYSLLFIILYYIWLIVIIHLNRVHLLNRKKWLSKEVGISYFDQVPINITELDQVLNISTCLYCHVGFVSCNSHFMPERLITLS